MKTAKFSYVRQHFAEFFDMLRYERVAIVTREVGRSGADIQQVMLIQVGNSRDIEALIDDVFEVLESLGQ